jgi:hypothetical protein
MKTKVEIFEAWVKKTERLEDLYRKEGDLFNVYRAIEKQEKLKAHIESLRSRKNLYANSYLVDRHQLQMAF